MKKLYCFMMLGAVLGLLALSCEKAPNPTAVPLSENPTKALAKANVVHHVSVGSADISLIPPGGDGNFSLIAIERADGSVEGEYQDSFGNNGFIHVEVTCLSIAGNDAWIGGTIKASNVFPVGTDVTTRVRDNGVSNTDPEDQASFSFVGFGFDCNNRPNLPLFDLNNGQVTIK